MIPRRASCTDVGRAFPATAPQHHHYHSSSSSSSSSVLLPALTGGGIPQQQAHQQQVRHAEWLPKDSPASPASTAVTSPGLPPVSPNTVVDSWTPVVAVDPTWFTVGHIVRNLLDSCNTCIEPMSFILAPFYLHLAIQKNDAVQPVLPVVALESVTQGYSPNRCGGSSPSLSTATVLGGEGVVVSKGRRPPNERRVVHVYQHHLSRLFLSLICSAHKVHGDYSYSHSFFLELVYPAATSPARATFGCIHNVAEFVRYQQHLRAQGNLVMPTQLVPSLSPGVDVAQGGVQEILARRRQTAPVAVVPPRVDGAMGGVDSDGEAEMTPTALQVPLPMLSTSASTHCPVAIACPHVDVPSLAALEWMVTEAAGWGFSQDPVALTSFLQRRLPAEDLRFIVSLGPSFSSYQRHRIRSLEQGRR